MKKSVIIMAIAASMLSTSAFAQINLSENTNTREITASGSISGTETTNLIALNVLNENGEKVYAAVIPTADGSVEGFKFKLPDVTGKYTVKFSSFANAEEIIYNYISNSDITSVLGTINGIEIKDGDFADEDSLIAVMDANREILSFDSYWYAKLGKDAKREIAAKILAGRNEGYTSLEEVKANARQQYCIEVFNSIEAKDALKFINEFAEELNWAENVTLYENYSAFSETEKTSLGEILAKEDTEELQNMYKAFDRSILLVSISNARDPKTLRELIDANTSIITFDLTKYNQSNKDTTASYIFGKTVSSMQDLENLIEEANKAQKKPTGGSSSSSSSSSSGSSGSSGKNNKNNGSSISYLPAVTKPEASKVSKFNDLAQAEWAAEAINELAEKGIISGISEKEFAPMENVTREQFVMMLYKAFNFSGKSEKEFTDIPQEHWAYEAVSAANANEIANGISETLFGAGKDITRQDMAVMAAKAAQKAGYKIEGSKSVDFDDIETVSEYAVDAVVKMAEAGVINGYEDNTVRPFENATRAQAAKIIFTIMQGVN